MTSVEIAKIPVVIFAGGRGARFDSLTEEMPKPMIQVAGKPILRHIIDSLADQGFREFIIPVGYLHEKIVEYFQAEGCTFSYNLLLKRWHVWIGNRLDPIFIKIWYTGEESHTGQRLLAVSELLAGRRFVMTYGDGLSDVPMRKVIEKHEKKAAEIWWGSERPDDPLPALLTLTAVCPDGRFGAVEMARIDDWGVGQVSSFEEKPRDSWINGGFMVAEFEFIERYLWGPEPIPMLEKQAMWTVAKDGRMRAYRHTGYWQCMDTRRDREKIESDVTSNDGIPPWYDTSR